ncbi:GTPase-activating protein GYP7 [Lachancea thermotolerans CBS 6340]|uniref:KLTH0B07964p n=1 Tax=Lachancea thermotolerans (strain ATCC 56472 / CBS 6340 / NRRL Y-8284) TaxID=559295 RepID=C5DD35_LACTC|nr:KLTH0B07964p [Lachancea thermotolerans CBS 6340]CAR21696.1 KLTH0B07964p [Lachancea thermotolerans CBS 6340]
MSTELLFCKSKVYVHCSKKAEDNIAGFLLITRDAQQPSLEATLSWIPERELSKLQLNELNRADGNTAKLAKIKKELILQAQYAAWAFCIKINSIYSIQFRAPSPSGWWYGSIAINSKNSHDQGSIPILFFHDKECASTQAKQKALNKSFDPFSGTDVYWGASDFRDAIMQLVDFKQTLVDPTVWLVNATLDDLRNFSPQDKKVEAEASTKDSTSPKFWDMLDQARWNVMSKFADFTSKSTNKVVNIWSQHPLVQFVDKHNNNPYVKKIMTNPKVQEIQDDFDSARIYLAKWALGVKEQAEKYQTANGLDDTYRRLLFNELGSDGEDVKLTDEELNIAMQRSHPLTRQKWDSFFDSEGRLLMTVQEVKDYIFHGGVADMELRKDVWLFLLEVYPWDSSLEERQVLTQTLRESYRANYKSKWEYRQPHSDEDEESYWHDQVLRVEKDVKRNDRDLSLYKYNTETGEAPASPQQDFDQGAEQVDSDVWTVKNPHLQSLRSILLSYNIYNNDLGYVQGMCDLLSPIYYILQDEELSFWAFVNFMRRMERNFLRDQSGIRDQMMALTDLCQLMLPKMSAHLAKCDSSNLFFCFRMLIVWFKREFEFEDVCSIWEVFLTDFYSSQFQLFFMLAVLQKNSAPVMNNLDQFDQVLKFFNELKGTMDWSDLMIRSELLFVKFKKIMDTLERRAELAEYTLLTSDGSVINESSAAASEQNALATQTSLITENLKQLMSKKIVIKREPARNKHSIR